MKEIIKHTILPHELKQEHKTGLIILKVLKVAHEILLGVAGNTTY